MQKYAKWLIVMLIPLFSLTLSSCSDDSNDEPDNPHPLTGYWVSDEMSYAYRFNKDGSGTGQSLPNGRLDKFDDYSVKDNHLSFKWEDDDEYDDKGTIDIKGNIFVLNLYDDGELFTFKKQ